MNGKKLFEFIAKYMPMKNEEKKAISDLATFRSYKKGAVVFREGQMAGETYFVISGCIRKYYTIDGEEKTTAFYTEFASVSKKSKTMSKPAPYNLACLEDTILLISNPSIENITFQKFPRFEKLCRILSEQLLAKNQASFDTFQTSTPKQRYLELLKKKPELLQRIPQYQLAIFLGIKPESLSRFRKRLREQVQQVVK